MKIEPKITIQLPYDKLIKECPSPQAREYMQQKQRKQIADHISKLLDEAVQQFIDEYRQSNTQDTGHLRRTSIGQRRKHLLQLHEEQKKKEMQALYNGIPTKIRYNRGNKKLWEE